ncbi:MAG TPA: HK97 family phage prohead protease [Methylomirabilota bacterium]|nr:HK97 family phage prohead protease [Methylomirabilota bacterium]
MHSIHAVKPDLNEFGERRVSLCDGRAGLRGGLQVDVREPTAAHQAGEVEPVSDQLPIPNPPSPVLDFIASNECLDRYDEIVTASGWDLENYRRNPVFQNAHQYGDILFTLGKALLTEVRAGCLFQRIEFATEANPMAKIAYGLYRGKFLNAVSVGFIPLRWENGSAESGFRRKYLEQELLEVSAVGIPANPEALQLGLKAGAIARSDLQELLALIETVARAIPSKEATALVSAPPDAPGVIPICSNPAVPNTHACASGVRGYEAQLLQLARQLRNILKR